MQSNNNSIEIIDSCNIDRASTVKSEKEHPIHRDLEFEESDVEIKVLYIEDQTIERIYTWTMPLQYSEMDILTAIFPVGSVLQDHFGYKLVREHTVQRIHVFGCPESTNSSGCGFHHILLGVQHMIVVGAPIMRLQKIENFDNFWNSEKFSDVTLCVSGRDIHAHKLILSNKSPVFDAMFTHDMSETRSNKVEITDVDYDTMCQLLQFIYTGYIGELGVDKESDVFVKYSNLFMAANKYCVVSLKVICEVKLLSILTVENVLECVFLADTHNADNLKAQAIEFISRNAEKIIELPSYKDFVVSYPDISIEITMALVSKKRKAKSVAEDKKAKKRKTK